MTLTSQEAVLWLYNQPGSEKSIQDCYFDKDIVQAAHRFWQSDEFRAVLSILRGQRPFSKILDLGAGRGIASFAFASEGYDVTALEPDPGPILGAKAIQEIINRTQVSIKVIKSYGERLPFRGESFDVVYIRQVLHHVEDLEWLCQEIYRVLEPGGLCLVTREHVLSKKEDLNLFRSKHMLHHLTGNESAFLLSEYLEAIARAGLHIKCIWGSYDSVINYFPSPLPQVKAASAAVLKPYVPARILRPFMEIPSIFRLCSKRCSHNDDTPGRLYSFLATRK
jgi:ubiquinone/menaquinone biosynthesis C-methylase UbiE